MVVGACRFVVGWMQGFSSLRWRLGVEVRGRNAFRRLQRRYQVQGMGVMDSGIAVRQVKEGLVLELDDGHQ